MVLWDYRLPHATSDRLEGSDSREVVYLGFLPSVEVNEVRVIYFLFFTIFNKPICDIYCSEIYCETKRSYRAECISPTWTTRSSPCRSRLGIERVE